MLSRKCLSPLLAILILAVAVGCATPGAVKIASQAQLDGFHDIKRQLSVLHRQIEDLLLTYADLNTQGYQRSSAGVSLPIECVAERRERRPTR